MGVGSLAVGPETVAVPALAQGFSGEQGPVGPGSPPLLRKKRSTGVTVMVEPLVTVVVDVQTGPLPHTDSAPPSWYRGLHRTLY